MLSASRVNRVIPIKTLGVFTTKKTINGASEMKGISPVNAKTNTEYLDILRKIKINKNKYKSRQTN